MKTEPNLNEPKKADEEKMEQDPTLSPRAQAVYNYLRREAFLGRAMPTRRAIADWLKITSLTSVDIHLKHLAARGLVEIVPGQQRGLVLKGTGEVPLLYVDGHGPLRRRLDPEVDVRDRMSGAVAKRFRGVTCFLQLGHYGMNVPGFTEGAIVALDTKAQQEAVSNGAILVARINDWIQCRVYRKIDERFAEYIDVDRDAGPLPHRVDLQKDSVVLEGVVLGCLQVNRLTMLPWYRELQPWFEGGGTGRQGTTGSHTAD
ncbi:MAG: hypothetical protein OXC01_16870 [Immundisolibacterales bacterium]|nr:hypothetical protein [Immundisolibacterales bacterium]